MNVTLTTLPSFAVIFLVDSTSNLPLDIVVDALIVATETKLIAKAVIVIPKSF